MSTCYAQGMRTTVRLDDAIMKAAKKAAVERNMSLTRFIEEALQEKLMKKNGPKRKNSTALVTYRGNGVQPGVDLDNSADLLQVMEG